MSRVLWRRPKAGLTAKQAAKTPAFQHARANGAGIVDALTSARWSDALRRNVLETIATSKKRSKAARKGWKTRRAKAAA